MTCGPLLLLLAPSQSTPSEIYVALNYISVPDLDFGQGIDQLSAENRIQAGYSEYLRNMDPTAEGYLRKRPGYQQYAGYLPVRIERLEYTDDATSNINFYLDSSVDVSSINLSDVRSTPLVVYGRTAEAHSEGDWSNTSAAKYYSAFTADPRVQLETGSNSLSIPGTTHNQGALVSVGLVASTSVLNNSNEHIYPDQISVDQSSSDITVAYTNNNAADIPAFYFVLDKSPVAGSVYNHTAAVSLGVNTISIPAGTHGLANFHILVDCYQDDGSSYTEFTPDDISITTNGTVTISFTNEDAAFTNAIFFLTAAPLANTKTGTISPNASLTVTLPALTGEFIRYKCYIEDIGTGALSEVLPDTCTVDATNLSAALTFENDSAASASFFIYWEYATVTTNRITVSGSTILTPYTDDAVQLTLWGLDHTEIYGSASAAERPGWVNHIDSYRSSAETRLVAGLGGNLFDARERSEVGTSHLLPLLYPRLNQRTGATSIIGPAFVDTTDTSSRTRGYLQFDGAGEGFARGTNAEYDSGTGWVKYTLAMPALQVQGTLSTIISSTPGLEDRLTVQQTENAVNAGDFLIKQVQVVGDTLEVWVENALINSSDWDEQDAGMQCGIFTDRIALDGAGEFLPEDRIYSDIFNADSFISVLACDSSTLLVSGATDTLTVPLGIRLWAARSSALIPLRTEINAASVTNLVAGDMLTYAELLRELRIVRINALSNTGITIDASESVGTITMNAGSTASLSIGQCVAFIQAGAASGEYRITEINSTTEFEVEFSSDLALTSQAGLLLGHTIEIDEELGYSDNIDNSLFFECARRWIPIESPAVSGNLPPQTHYRYFSANAFADQPALRSVMVADTLFPTNYADAVYKYDGTNAYRAGLIRWQPGLFFSFDTSPSAPEQGEIALNLANTTPSAISANIFTVPLGEELKFRTGAVIRHTFTGGFTDYTVDSTFDDGSDGFVKVNAFDAIVLGASPVLSETATYRYYFRLNAVDANQNTIASAITGSQDSVVRLSETAQVRIKLIGLPAWDVYDYDRLEVEIYRTKQNGVAPFYRLASLPMLFNSATGYIEYIDTDSDEVLTDLDLVSSALLGAELGLTWTDPPRAKYVTSAGNRLVLANIKGYPALDIQLVDSAARIRNASGDAQLTNLIWLFRRDNTDSATSTNMVDRVRYQFRTSGAVTIDPALDIATTPTSFTITEATHGLVAKDWVYLFHSTVSDGNALKFAGWYQIASATTNDFTISAAVGTYTPSADDVDRYVTAVAQEDVPVWLGTDGNYATINGNLASATDAAQFIAVRRLANAINASMRQCNTALTGQSAFDPWLIGNAGGEFQFGQLVVTQPKVLDTALELVLPAFSGFNIFVNALARNASTSASALTALNPSRVVISYPNYPEIFDNAFSVLDSQSQSAIDINPADGQEITGVIPFFGDSAFGASQQDGVIVVFKTNSIYLVNLAAKAAGQNAVQKLESRGLGCTAPYSIAPTQNGIMFANESGIYRLTKSLVIQPVGRWIDRIWKSSVDKTASALGTMAGHYYTAGSQYKLSVPFNTNTSPQHALVYNTLRELQADSYRDGGWTTYDTHPAIGWANLQTDAFFASTLGQVFKIRDTGLNSDFRDSSAPITAQATLRAMDFGDAGIRKALSGLVMNFRTAFNDDSSTLESAVNLTDDFQPLDAFRVLSETTGLNGLTDPNARKVETILFSVDRRKFAQLQVRITNAALDEPLEISGITYRVAGLTQSGLTQAAETTD